MTQRIYAPTEDCLLLISLACMDYRVQTHAESVRPGNESPGEVVAEDTGRSLDLGDDTGLREDTGSEARADQPEWPEPGNMVVNELMIDPSSVDDALGEWVEVLNTSSAYLDVNEAWIGDDDLDLVQLQPLRDLVLGPGEAMVVCVSSTDNGGVACDATVPYDTFGDGFAMSNTRDEVVFYNRDLEMLDRVAWDDGFAPTGRSAALDPDAASVSGNDDAGAWCSQSATPGSQNGDC